MREVDQHLAVAAYSREDRDPQVLLRGTVAAADEHEAGGQPLEVPLPRAGRRLVEVVEIEDDDDRAAIRRSRSSGSERRRRSAGGCPSAGCRPGPASSCRPHRGSRRTVTTPCGRRGWAPAWPPAVRRAPSAGRRDRSGPDGAFHGPWLLLGVARRSSRPARRRSDHGASAIGAEVSRRPAIEPRFGLAAEPAGGEERRVRSRAGPAARSSATAPRPGCATRPRVWGTACNHAAWQRPPITRRSPLAGARSMTPVMSSESALWPVSGRISHGRAAPIVRTPITVSSSQRSSRSRWKPTPSRSSRYCARATPSKRTR